MKTKNNTRETADDQVRRMVLLGSAFLGILISVSNNQLNLLRRYSHENGQQ